MIDVTLDDIPAPAVDPRPRPAPAPQPAPVPAPPGRGVGWRDWLHIALFCTTLAMIVVVGGDLIWKVMQRETRPGPTPTPDVVSEAAKTTAIKFIPRLASAYGEGWIAAADALEKGKSAAESQKILQEKWKDERVKELLSVVKPTFEGFLPEGQEPADPAKRAQVVQLWREFGRWLQKGGR